MTGHGEGKHALRAAEHDTAADSPSPGTDLAPDPPEAAATEPARLPEPVRMAEPVRIAAPDRMPDLAEFPLWPDSGQPGAGPHGNGQNRQARSSPVRLARPPKAPRRPAAGLPFLVVFALAATFFAWVSAEPLWLDLGHGDRGTVTVTRCTGDGVGQRCVGRFVAAGDRYVVGSVGLTAAPTSARRAGSAVAARMVSADAKLAYAGTESGLHLRWGVGLALVLLCGFAIAASSGAWRLRGGARYGVIGVSLLGPALLTAGMLAIAW